MAVRCRTDRHTHIHQRPVDARTNARVRLWFWWSGSSVGRKVFGVFAGLARSKCMCVCVCVCKIKHYVGQIPPLYLARSAARLYVRSACHRTYCERITGVVSPSTHTHTQSECVLLSISRLRLICRRALMHYTYAPLR